MLRIGIVGTGRRAVSFADDLTRSPTVRARAELVALCDINAKRLATFQSLYAPGISTFTDYAAFLREARLDGVIVTTPCNTHAALTIQALESGKHVLCEKAMAIRAADLKAILEAERRSGKRLQLGLCLRYADFMRELIPILRRGEIGEVRMVSVVETLEGSSHFNRWHRDRTVSGGIMLQKGTHTLDLVNWIVDGHPRSVTAIGGRDVYKPRAECAGRRCSECPESATCAAFLGFDGGDGSDRRLYKECEDADGYLWDRCVFDPAADICDHVLTQVEYDNGRRAQYAISLFYVETGIEREFVILGDRGRIDVSRRREEIVIHRRRSKDVIRYNLEGHGEGFETEMGDFLDMVATGRTPLADSQAGYWSALAGIAAEQSMAERRTVAIAEFLG
jgi:predicted dehydrogenase